MSITIEVTELPGRLKEMLQMVEAGTEVLLRDGDSTAKLTTVRPTRLPHEPRIPGLSLGAAIMSPDFDDPEDIELWYGPIEPNLEPALPTDCK